METENKKWPSAISYMDYGNWELGKECMTVLLNRPDGTQVVIGRIHFNYDDHEKRAVYRSYDADGKELYVPNFSLMQVKKQFKRHEAEFVARAEALDQQPRIGGTIDEFGATGTVITKTPHTPIPSPYTAELPKEKKRSKQLNTLHKSKSKQRSRGR